MKWTREAIRAELAKDYLKTQYAATEYLTSHLSDLNRRFDGDLTEVLVLAVIGQVALRAAANGKIASLASINASSIADETGIPRETVRRKLRRLKEKGLIEKTAEGWRIRIDEVGNGPRSQFADLEKRHFDRLAKLVSDLTGAIGTAPPASESPMCLKDAW